MPYEMILTETRDRVGIITFNRPEKLNALHPVMSGEMRDQIEVWNNDSGIGAIVLTAGPTRFQGSGQGFSGKAPAGFS